MSSKTKLYKIILGSREADMKTLVDLSGSSHVKLSSDQSTSMMPKIVSSKEIILIDTPGLGGNNSYEEFTHSMEQIISALSTNTIDAFLLVVNVQAKTLKKELKQIVNTFGAEALGTLIICVKDENHTYQAEEDAWEDLKKMKEVAEILNGVEGRPFDSNWICLHDNIELSNKMTYLKPYSCDNFLEAQRERRNSEIRLQSDLNEKKGQNLRSCSKEMAKLRNKVLQIESDLTEQRKELVIIQEKIRNEVSDCLSNTKKVFSEYKADLIKFIEELNIKREQQFEELRQIAKNNSNNQEQVRQLLHSNSEQMKTINAQILGSNASEDKPPNPKRKSILSWLKY